MIKYYNINAQVKYLGTKPVVDECIRFTICALGYFYTVHPGYTFTVRLNPHPPCGRHCPPFHQQLLLTLAPAWGGVVLDTLCENTLRHGQVNYLIASTLP